ncbi:hypothetical protein APV28_0050 [Comamonas testosteroni]|nr:hypothetical protein APV28_0050 [Comamonas testosteroni]
MTVVFLPQGPRETTCVHRVGAIDIVVRSRLLKAVARE